jgi:hypothetical protein
MVAIVALFRSIAAVHDRILTAKKKARSSVQNERAK